MGAFRAAGSAIALAGAVAFAGLSCDAAGALRSPGVKDVVLRWTGDTVLVAGSSIPAAVEATVDGEAYPFPRVVVSSSDTTIVAVRADGATLDARRLGEATLSVRLVSAALPGSAVAIERVVRVVPRALTLGGLADTLRSVGDTATLRATAIDAQDRPLTDLAAAWSSTDTLVAVVDAAGLVTARRDGEATVRATVGGLAAETKVRVKQRVTRLALGPSLVLDALDADLPLVGAAVDGRGNAVARLAGALVWETSAPAIVGVTAGRALAEDNGTAWVRATADGVRDSVRVEVIQRATRIVVETQGPLALRSVGETAVLRARGYDRRDNEVRLALPTWRSQNQPVAYVEPRTGILTAIATGDAVLVAELDGASATLAVQVADVPDRVVADPQTAALESVGDTLRVRWSVKNARGVEVVGAPVTVGSSDTTVAIATPEGHVVGMRTGTTRVVVAAGAVADTVMVTVANAVAQVDLVPSVLTLASVGDTVVPAVVVRTARGQDLPSGAASWRSANAAIASVLAGVVTARAAGETFVVAESPTYADRRDSVLVVVTDAPATLRLTAERDTLTALGQTRVYGTDVRNARGGAIIGFPVAWESTDPTIATVSPTGVVTATGLGAAGIVARAGVAADTVLLAVRNALASLEVSPGAASLTSIGDTVRLQVVGRNGVGAVVAGVAADWRSLDTLVASSLGDGRVVAVGTGTARVVATAEGFADTATVLVANAVAVVALQDAPIVLASIADSIQPVVSLANARGAALPRGAALWTSDDPLVARVTTSGIVIATGIGETLVRAAATGGTARDSVAVTVTNAPATVVIDATADTVSAVGRTRAHAAEVRNGRGALLAVPATWRTLDPPVASVSASGVVTALAVGTARIVATAGAVSDTLTMLVLDVPVSLELSPATMAIRSIGDTTRITTIARNELGVAITGVAVSWRSTDSTVARALADGFVAAMGTGTARVVGTVGALADTVVVTVTDDVAFVDLARTADTLVALGDSLVPAVTVRNARDVALARTALTWTSDDPIVARVSAAGTITARDTGSTWVRAAGGEASDSIRIVVQNLAASVRMLTALGTDASADTMTAVGQAVTYSVAVRNRNGATIAGAPVTWRSTDLAVATVSESGVVTAAGVGGATVIVRAGEVEDSVGVVVLDPTRLYVDNSVPSAMRFGTPARPFATIQDAVNAAGVDDTVFVMRGSGYSESVTLTRRITLLGDSAAFVSGARDPLLLPRLRHDLGLAGIAASTAGASYTVRYLAIQHTVDGEAIAVRDPSTVTIEYVYVNPSAAPRTGRGILIERPAGLASIERSRVDSVNAFGVRLVDADGARVIEVAVRGVGARTGFNGAGIELSGGTGGTVQTVATRRTAGPQVLFVNTTDASLLGSELTGEQQLLRLASVRGATNVSGSLFDMRAQAGDPVVVRGGAAPDPSGVEISTSAGVTVQQNVFRAPGGQTSLMDGVRLVDVRVGATGAAFGALLARNQFGGGRTAVRSERSSWSLSASRSDSAFTPVLLGAADTVTLSADTLVNAREIAVQSTGASASLTVLDGLVSGPRRAVVVSGASRAVVRGTSVLGLAGAAKDTTLGAVDLEASTVEVVGASVIGYPAFAGVLLRGGTARLDSSTISRNYHGVRLGALSVITMRHNAVFDNDELGDASNRSAVGVINDGAARALGANWWGDLRGPNRAGRATRTVGDSIVLVSGAGAVVLSDSLAAPIPELSGIGTTVGTLRKIGGDGQSATRNATLATPLAVRVLDAAGRPLGGVTVTFESPTSPTSNVEGDFSTCVTGNNTGLCTVTTDASGLVEVRFDLENRTGNALINVYVNKGLATERRITFNATST